MEKQGVNVNQSSPSFSKVLTDKEVAQQLRDACKGSFYTSAEVKEQLKKWKKKRA